MGKNNTKITLESFINRANIIHNYKYDYDLVKLIKNSRDKVQIICKRHGIFTVTINSHLNGIKCKNVGIKKGIKD